MPMWICRVCESHFPSGIGVCPKCVSPDYSESVIPTKTLEFKEWLCLHDDHDVHISELKTGNVLLKCKRCVEYYLI